MTVADTPRKSYHPREYSFDELETAMLLTEREVAEQLRVKPCTVRNERLRGQISYVRVHSRFYYTQEQITEYIEAHSTPANVGLAVPEETSACNKPASRQDKSPMQRPRSEYDKQVSALAKQVFARGPRTPKRPKLTDN